MRANRMIASIKRLFQRSVPKNVPHDVIEMRQVAQKLADRFSFERIEAEPLPPWLQYPQILIGSIGWRMGPGEDYLHDVFYPYWWSLDTEQQNEYIEKFDLGATWPDRGKWLRSLDRNRLSRAAASKN